MKNIKLVVLPVLLCMAGAGTAQSRVAQGKPTPPPAYQALMGTELEKLTRFHSVLNNVCGDHSLDQQLVGKSMLLQIKLLGDLNALEEVENSDDLAWLLNVYYSAYGSGFKPGVDHIENSDPGAKARICATLKHQAKALLGDA